MALLKDNPTQLVLSLDNPTQANLAPTPLPNPLVTAPAVTKPQPPPLMVKVPEPLSAAEFAGQAYQHAIDLMNQNRINEAIVTLRELLAQMPNFVPQRLLIGLLLQEQRFAEAYQVVQIGLHQYPDSPTFLLALARIETAEGQFVKALTTLQTINPPLRGNTEYYGLMAGLYQRIGQPQLAINLYVQLLELNPNNSTWWLGLGVCLEAVGRNSQAVVAYQKASFTHTLDPQLQGFVNYRIQVLWGLSMENKPNKVLRIGELLIQNKCITQNN